MANSSGFSVEVNAAKLVGQLEQESKETHEVFSQIIERLQEMTAQMENNPISRPSPSKR